ncbi:hypothetical protein WJX84_009104 [Apatococcus fuscideae]|uniref:TPX2 central domain-containing protein n=1 Tax=Apatococcus fuscideae TaxID=2026836 RepID=A0AAW1SS93_9CHLO
MQERDDWSDLDEPARDRMRQARGIIPPTQPMSGPACDLSTTTADTNPHPAAACPAQEDPAHTAAADQPLMDSPPAMTEAEGLAGGSPMDECMAQSPVERRERTRSASAARRVGALGIQGQARREPLPAPAPAEGMDADGAPDAKSKRPSNLVTSWAAKIEPAGRAEGSKRKANARPNEERGQSNGSRANTRKTNHSPPEAAQPSRQPANAAAHASAKTSEQIQWEQAKAGAEMAARQRRQNGERVGKALLPPTSANSRSTKPLTIPVDLHLSTSKRRRLHQMSARPAGSEAGSEQGMDVTSHSEAAGGAQRPMFPAGPTHSQAPSFATDGRQRRSQFKSREQMEEEEMAAMPIFHALPVNPSVLAGPRERGRRARAASQPLSANEAPRLATAERAAHARPQQTTEDPSSQAFHAQPLNQRILEGPDFEPKRGVQPATKAQGPQLQTQHRARAQGQQAAQEPFIFKAAAAQEKHPRPPRAQRRQKGRAASVEPQGFALATEQRGQARAEMERQQREQQEAAEKEAALFRARPVPLTSSSGHPGFFARAASAQPLTIPEPFQLASETRHHEAEVLQELQNRQQEEERRQKANFKARPVPQSWTLQCPNHLITL